MTPGASSTLRVRWNFSRKCEREWVESGVKLFKCQPNNDKTVNFARTFAEAVG